MMKHPILLALTFGLMLSGCAVLDRLKGAPKADAAAGADNMATEIASPVETTSLDTMGQGQSPDALDTTSAAEKTAALSAPAAGGERDLGKVVVALGSPAEQGLWVQTALVTAVVQGRVVAANGQSLAVELRPGTGGALMSLAAYQALGIGLTELPEITVFAP